MTIFFNYSIPSLLQWTYITIVLTASFSSKTIRYCHWHCHGALSLFSVTIHYHCSLSLFTVTIVCHCSLSLFTVTVLCHCSLSLFTITVSVSNKYGVIHSIYTLVFVSDLVSQCNIKLNNGS
jgi:hypothetical protein